MNKQILRLAIPNIISNITIPLLGLVDVGLMGHLDSPDIYIGAVALGGVIFNILYWAFTFVRMGTSGITAQNYGGNDPARCMMTLSRALFVCFVGAFILILFQTPIEKICFLLLEGESHIEDLARSYFYIRIYAAPAVFALYAFSGWFIGMQNSWIPMIIAISVNILNIVFSYTFVYTFNLHVKGVAWGTLLSQYFGVLIALIFLFLRYKIYLRDFSIRIFNELKEFKYFYKINIHIFLRTLCIIFVFTFFTSKSAASENNIILSVNMILLQFVYMVSYFLDGYAYAGEALVGKFIGRKEENKLLLCIRQLFIWGFFTSASITIIYLFKNRFIISVLTDSSIIIETATHYALWLILFPLVSFSSFLWDGIYIGATTTKQMFISMFIATFIFFLPSYYLLYPKIHNHGLWIAMLLFMFVRGLSQTIIWKKYLVKKRL